MDGYPNTVLKLDLMHHGISVDEEARAQMKKDRFGQFHFADFVTTGGLVLRLNNGIYVNTPLESRKTPFLLTHNETEGMQLMRDGIVLPHSVEVIPTPKFALEVHLLDGRIPIRNLVNIHGDRARISPIQGCHFHCHFCSTSRTNYRKMELDVLERAFQEALQDPYASFRHALISGGTPKEEQADYDYIDQVYAHFPRQYPDMEWDVMLSPRSKKPEVHNRQAYQEYLSFLRECGISTLSANLELFNDAKSKSYMEGKHRIGRDNYLVFIEEAVKTFGKGMVRSSLIVGLESKEDTLNGVEALCSINCLPVLSPFVQDPRTNLAQQKKPAPDFLLEVLIEANAIAQAHGSMLGPVCVPCRHNSLSLEDSTTV